LFKKTTNIFQVEMRHAHKTAEARRREAVRCELLPHIYVSNVQDIVIEFVREFQGEHFASIFGCGRYAMSPSPDGKQIVGIIDHSVHFWDVHTGKPCRSFLQHPQPVNTALFLPDGRVATCTSLNDHVDISTAHIWDDGELVLTENLGLFKKLVFFKDDTFVVVGLNVFTWNVKTGSKLFTGWIEYDAVAMPNNKIATVSGGGFIYVYDMNTLRTESTTYMSEEITAIAAVDEQRVVVALVLGTIALVNVARNQVEQVYEGHTEDVNVFALMDGNKLVSGSLDETVRVWDLKTGQQLMVLQHPEEIVSLFVLPGGVLATHCKNGTVQFFM